MSMNKKVLVQNVSAKAEVTKADAEKVINATLGVISDALANGDTVRLTGFGEFLVRNRAERKGRNPQTGETIVIAATKVPAFKPGKGLKDAVK